MRYATWTGVASFAASLLWLAGCATAGSSSSYTTSSDQVRNTIYSTHRLVQDLERDMSVSVSDLSARIDSQEQDLRRLSSVAQENQYKLEVLQRSLDELTITLYRQFDLTLPTRITNPSSVAPPTRIYDSGSGYSGSDVSVSPPSTGTRSTGGSDVTVLPPTTETTQAEDPIVTFNRGLELFAQDKYVDALTKFDEYLRVHPTGASADRAQYRIGKCYLRLGDFERAISEFSKVWQAYPNSQNVVPAAMHDAAVSYSRLGQNERAIELFQRVIREYPDGEAAEGARRKLRQLQGVN